MNASHFIPLFLLALPVLAFSQSPPSTTPAPACPITFVALPEVETASGYTTPLPEDHETVVLPKYVVTLPRNEFPRAEAIVGSLFAFGLLCLLIAKFPQAKEAPLPQSSTALKDDSLHTKGSATIMRMTMGGQEYYAVGILHTRRAIALCGPVGAHDDGESEANSIRIARAWNLLAGYPDTGPAEQ